MVLVILRARAGAGGVVAAAAARPGVSPVVVGPLASVFGTSPIAGSFGCTVDLSSLPLREFGMVAAALPSVVLAATGSGLVLCLVCAWWSALGGR